MKLSSGARYAGVALFVIGTIILGVSISNMMPDGNEGAYTGEMFSQFIVNIGMLLVATFMVAIGMFFIAYGGEYGSPGTEGERRSGEG